MQTVTTVSELTEMRQAVKALPDKWLAGVISALAELEEAGYGERHVKDFRWTAAIELATREDARLYTELLPTRADLVLFPPAEDMD